MVENSTQKAPHAGNDDNSSTKPYSEAFFLGFNNPTPGLEAEHSSTSPAPRTPKHIIGKEIEYRLSARLVGSQNKV